MDIFVQQILNGLVLGSVYAIIALGYTMVYGILGIINFAQGDVLMIGAMADSATIAPIISTSRCATLMRPSMPYTSVSPHAMLA